MSDPKSPSWTLRDEDIADPIPPVPVFAPDGTEEAIAAAAAQSEQVVSTDLAAERAEFQALLDFIAANKDPDTELVATSADDFLSPTITSNKE